MRPLSSAVLPMRRPWSARIAPLCSSASDDTATVTEDAGVRKKPAQIKKPLTPEQLAISQERREKRDEERAIRMAGIASGEQGLGKVALPQGFTASFSFSSRHPPAVRRSL